MAKERISDERLAEHIANVKDALAVDNINSFGRDMLALLTELAERRAMNEHKKATNCDLHLLGGLGPEWQQAVEPAKESEPTKQETWRDRPPML